MTLVNDTEETPTGHDSNKCFNMMRSHDEDIMFCNHMTDSVSALSILSLAGVLCYTETC